MIITIAKNVFQSMFRNEQFLYGLLKIQIHNPFSSTLIGSTKCIIDGQVNTRSYIFIIIIKKQTKTNKIIAL